jgi:hypothetical protein
MLFLPTSYIEVKLLLLSLSLIIIIVSGQFKSQFYSKIFTIWFFSFICFYLSFTLLGIIYGNPGTIDYLRLFIVWPFIYLILILYINSRRIIFAIIKLLITITFIISTYNIYKLLEFINIVPRLFNLKDGFEIGIHPGFTQIITLNIGSLAFLLAFLISNLATGKKMLNEMKISNLFLIITIIATVICSIISGRRILWLVLFISTVSTLAIIMYLNKSYSILKKILKYVLIILVVSLLLGNLFSDKLDLNYQSMKSRFTEEFDSTVDSPRNLQKAGLIDGFLKFPILGSGFGIGIPSVIRSDERPWTYELTYYLYLYNTGIIGIVVFLIILLYPVLWSIRLVKNDPNLRYIIYPVMSGYISVLIASATNPYFTSSFDFEWMIFLPLGILNYLQKATKINIPTTI